MANSKRQMENSKRQISHGEQQKAISLGRAMKNPLKLFGCFVIIL
jgi:hypothetical protein